jgi:COP9 signalosome complex subunit 5
LSTQLAWQNAEDNQGNPFLAIVIDPLRSFAKNTAELSAFRAYPPTVTPPANQCPDGALVTEDAKRVEIWGSCWNRYYELKVEYFMSGQAKSIIDTLNHSHLWARSLAHTPALQPEHRARVGERVGAVVEKLEAATASSASGGARLGAVGGSFGFPSEPLGGGGGGSPAPPGAAKESALKKASDAAAGIACETLQSHMSQLTKRRLFSGSCDSACACNNFANLTAEYLKRKRERAANAAAAPSA